MPKRGVEIRKSPECNLAHGEYPPEDTHPEYNSLKTGEAEGNREFTAIRGPILPTPTPICSGGFSPVVIPRMFLEFHVHSTISYWHVR